MMIIIIIVMVTVLFDDNERLSGALWSYFVPGPRNSSRKPPWSTLELLFDLGPEMAPGSLSGALWDYFLAWAQKWLQEASLDLSGAIF